MIALLTAFVLHHFDAGGFWWGMWVAMVLFEIARSMK